MHRNVLDIRSHEISNAANFLFSVLRIEVDGISFVRSVAFLNELPHILLQEIRKKNKIKNLRIFMI